MRCIAEPSPGSSDRKRRPNDSHPRQATADDLRLPGRSTLEHRGTRRNFHLEISAEHSPPATNAGGSDDRCERMTAGERLFQLEISPIRHTRGSKLPNT